MSSETKKDKEKENGTEIDKESKKYKFYSGNGGMNFPNRLTIVRVILIPIFILFYFVPFPGHYFVALAVFIISTLTDMADGRIARKYNLISDFGKLLDPIADKVLVLSAFVCFISDTSIFYDNSTFGSWGLILAGIGVVLIIAREIMVAGIRLVAADKGIAIAADWFGKIKTVTQYISIFVLLFGTGLMNVASGSGTAVYSTGLYFDYLGFAVMMLSVVFTVISGVNYIIQNRAIFKASSGTAKKAPAEAAVQAAPVKPYMRPALCLLCSSSAAASEDAQTVSVSGSSVPLKEVMESAKFANIRPGVMTVALGKTEEGEPICPNLTNLQHMLLSGSNPEVLNGSLNSIILSLVYRLGPKELRLMMIDCTSGAFAAYKGLPHLNGKGIISTPEDAIGELSLLQKEMDMRLDLLRKASEEAPEPVRNIDEYNRQLEPGGERLPHILVVISDLSVLMQRSASLTESAVAPVLHLAKACGIHLLIATTNASAGIPASVKASISTRAAFGAASAEESVQFIGREGAESLNGHDMLYKGNSVADPVLIHACSVSGAEVSAVCASVCGSNK
ncbi:MAG: CDP-diacylglycerol--glycerol-3-phosphate 3-phosphatidyltransferase [Clostridia bacterium]|nr:CDP-diacylglycerol--glycerol-3-phosphate 3-phosphatidyltransferase [Clostridia bacterium]